MYLVILIMVIYRTVSIITIETDVATERKDMTTTALRDFLEIPYDKLEELNLEAKSARLERTPADVAE